MDMTIRYVGGDFDPYTGIAKQLCILRGIKMSERFPAVLEETFTPQEAYLCLELFEPATLKELVKRLDTEEEEFKGALDSLVERSVIYKRKTKYGFPHPSIIETWQTQGLI